MQTDDLSRTYADFVETARHGRFVPPTDGGWTAEMVLAHVVIGDRLIAEAAARVMAGVPTTFDNLGSQSEPYLRSVAEAAGGWDGLLAALQRGGDELIALARCITDEQAATPIAARIISDNAVVFDATVPLSTLMGVPADTHLRLHTQQLAALSGEGVHAGAAQPSSARRA